MKKSQYVVAIVMTNVIYRKVEANDPFTALNKGKCGDDREIGYRSRVTGAYVVDPKSLDKDLRKELRRHV